MNRGLVGIGDGCDWTRDNNAKSSMMQNGRNIRK